MKKIILHRSMLANQPPRAGPKMVVIAENIDQVPIAFPLDSCGKLEEGDGVARIIFHLLAVESTGHPATRPSEYLRSGLGL